MSGSPQHAAQHRVREVDGPVDVDTKTLNPRSKILTQP